MRPFGHIRLALGAALVEGGGTCRDLAARVNEPVHRVRVVLDNMVRAGDAAKRLQPVRVPGVRRPVPFYQRPVVLDDDDATPMLSLIQCWMARPAHAGQGVAM